MGRDDPRIQGFHLWEGVGVSGWIQGCFMEPAPSKCQGRILAISSFGSRVLEAIGGVFVTFVAAGTQRGGGVSKTRPLSWTNFTKNAYVLGNYRGWKSLGIRMLETGSDIGWVQRGGPWKSPPRGAGGPAGAVQGLRGYFEPAVSSRILRLRKPHSLP